MLVYLIGFMGCGKTTLGRRMSRALGWPFVDLDERIESRTGKNITAIFEESGEHRFRELERDELAAVAAMSSGVVATGGGTPCYFENMSRMNGTGKTIYLRMAPGALFHRLARSKNNRPLIAGKLDAVLMEEISDRLPGRESYYMQAQHVVDGLHATADDLIRLIETQTTGAIAQQKAASAGSCVAGTPSADE